MVKKYPRVSILILNWNGWRDTTECLESVYQTTYPNYEVVVIDNCSANNSVEKIKEWADGKTPVESKFFKYNSDGKPIKYIKYDRATAERGGDEREEEIKDLPSNKKIVIIQTGENLGFAGGSNIGIRYVIEKGSDYVLLLNNDTVVDKEFLEPLIKTAESNKENGIVGPKIYYYYDPEIIQAAGGKVSWTGLHSLIGEKEKDICQHDKIKEVGFISGAAMMIKRHVTEDVGLFDEDYFLYTEDVDWCYRVSKKGYKLIYIPSSKVWHKGSSSIRKTKNSTPLYYRTRNKILFMRKNANLIHWMIFLPFFSLFILKNLIKCGVSRDIEGVKSIINGIMWHFFS